MPQHPCTITFADTRMPQRTWDHDAQRQAHQEVQGAGVVGVKLDVQLNGLGAIQVHELFPQHLRAWRTRAQAHGVGFSRLLGAPKDACCAPQGACCAPQRLFAVHQRVCAECWTLEGVVGCTRAPHSGGWREALGLGGVGTCVCCMAQWKRGEGSGGKGQGVSWGALAEAGAHCSNWAALDCRALAKQAPWFEPGTHLHQILQPCAQGAHLLFLCYDTRTASRNRCAQLHTHVHTRTATCTHEHMYTDSEANAFTHHTRKRVLHQEHVYAHTHTHTCTAQRICWCAPWGQRCWRRWCRAGSSPWRPIGRVRWGSGWGGGWTRPPSRATIRPGACRPGSCTCAYLRCTW